jgi:uncharacterized protein (DUF488 family)
VTDEVRLWTIGHSNSPGEHLLGLLDDVSIEALVDVRSQPYSRFNPQFNREPLTEALGAVRIRYLHLGDALGGRPADPDLYDDDGRVSYERVARTDPFVAGIDRLVDGAARYRVAIMCSEENPERCHRRLLITPMLRERDVRVTHVRGDGSSIDEDDLAAAIAARAAPTLFADPPT